MAGFAAFQSGDYKKSRDFGLNALDVVNNFVKDENKAHWMETVIYYNLSIASSAQYQRSEAEGFISKALDVCMMHNISQFKQRIIAMYEEYFGEFVEEEENKNEEVETKRLEFNFIPGAIEKDNNKIVELKCESPKDRAKRTKNSKRSLSRA